LAHLLGLRVELRRGVRAGPLAVAATNALIGVDGDDAVLPLVHRGRRADLRADQVLAVIAGDRCVVGEGLVVKHPVGEVPVPAGVLHDPAPVGTQRGGVLVLAGDLAGLAADTQALVEVETQPPVCLGSGLPSHVCLPCGLSQAFSSAAGGVCWALPLPSGDGCQLVSVLALAPAPTPLASGANQDSWGTEITPGAMRGLTRATDLILPRSL